MWNLFYRSGNLESLNGLNSKFRWSVFQLGYRTVTYCTFSNLHKYIECLIFACRAGSAKSNLAFFKSQIPTLVQNSRSHLKKTGSIPKIMGQVGLGIWWNILLFFAHSQFQHRPLRVEPSIFQFVFQSARFVFEPCSIWFCKHGIWLYSKSSCVTVNIEISMEIPSLQFNATVNKPRRPQNKLKITTVKLNQHLWKMPCKLKNAELKLKGHEFKLAVHTIKMSVPGIQQNSKQIEKRRFKLKKIEKIMVNLFFQLWSRYMARLFWKSSLLYS